MPPTASLFHRKMLSALFGMLSLPGVAPVLAEDTPSNHGETAASQTLELLRKDYTRRYGHLTAFAVMDPDRLAAEPVWMTSKNRYNNVFAGSGLSLTDEEANSLDFMYLMRASSGPYSGGGNDDIPDVGLGHVVLEAFALAGRRYTQHDAQPFCLVSPAHPDFNALPIPALGDARTIRFINRHEFWHCLQSPVYLDADPRIMQDAEGALPLGLYADAAAVLQRETRADLGAVSDMIAFDNEGTQVIAVIAQWRQGRLKSPDGHDVHHYSSFALSALKRHIDRVGVDAWRALDDTARTLVIDRCLEHETMNAQALRDYLLAVNGGFTLPAVSTDVQLVADSDPALRDWLNAARHFAGYQATPSATPAPGGTAIVLDDHQKEELGQWDAAKALRRAAGDRLTQASLRQARADLLDRLRADIAANPNDPLGGARIIKLEQAYRQLLTPQLAQQTATQMPQRKSFSRQP